MEAVGRPEGDAPPGRCAYQGAPGAFSHEACLDLRPWDEAVPCETFEAALRVLRPGGTLSSLGVYSSDLKIPLAPFLAGLGDHTIVTTLCPGGKERMRRLMEVIASGRLDTRPLVTHRFNFDQIEEAYDLFANQRDGVLKVAITP